MILPVEYSTILYPTSFIPLISSVYAITNGMWVYSLIPTCVSGSSILYWYNPDYSWRRYLDMAVVQVGFICITWLSFYSATQAYFIITEIIAICMFYLGVYFYKHKHHYYSALAHSGLHILATLANIIVFMGISY